MCRYENGRHDHKTDDRSPLGVMYQFEDVPKGQPQDKRHCHPANNVTYCLKEYGDELHHNPLSVVAYAVADTNNGVYDQPTIYRNTI